MKPHENIRHPNLWGDYIYITSFGIRFHQVNCTQKWTHVWWESYSFQCVCLHLTHMFQQKHNIPSHMFHVWNIYQHLPWKHVGKYNIHGAYGHDISILKTNTSKSSQLYPRVTALPGSRHQNLLRLFIPRRSHLRHGERPATWRYRDQAGKIVSFHPCKFKCFMI